jgi:hypothetical protein
MKTEEFATVFKNWRTGSSKWMSAGMTFGTGDERGGNEVDGWKYAGNTNELRDFTADCEIRI